MTDEEIVKEVMSRPVDPRTKMQMLIEVLQGKLASGELVAGQSVPEFAEALDQLTPLAHPEAEAVLEQMNAALQRAYQRSKIQVDDKG